MLTGEEVLGVGGVSLKTLKLCPHTDAVSSSVPVESKARALRGLWWARN